MRKQYGRSWPLMSFFLVYLIQQGMLVGLTLPLYAVFSSSQAWRPLMDLLATAGCLVGEPCFHKIERALLYVGYSLASRCSRCRPGQRKRALERLLCMSQLHSVMAEL